MSTSNRTFLSLRAIIITTLVLTVAAWGQAFTESFGVITFSGQGRLTEIESLRPPLVQQKGGSQKFLRIPQPESTSRFAETQRLNWMVRYRSDEPNSTALQPEGFELHRLRVQGQSRLLIFDEKGVRLPLESTRIGQDHLRLVHRQNSFHGKHDSSCDPS